MKLKILKCCYFKKNSEKDDIRIHELITELFKRRYFRDFVGPFKNILNHFGFYENILGSLLIRKAKNIFQRFQNVYFSTNKSSD